MSDDILQAYHEQCDALKAEARRGDLMIREGERISHTANEAWRKLDQDTFAMLYGVRVGDDVVSTPEFVAWVRQAFPGWGEHMFRLFRVGTWFYVDDVSMEKATVQLRLIPGEYRVWDVPPDMVATMREAWMAQEQVQS